MKGISLHGKTEKNQEKIVIHKSIVVWNPSVDLLVHCLVSNFVIWCDCAIWIHSFLFMNRLIRVDQTSQVGSVVHCWLFNFHVDNVHKHAALINNETFNHLCSRLVYVFQYFDRMCSILCRLKTNNIFFILLKSVFELADSVVNDFILMYQSDYLYSWSHSLSLNLHYQHSFVDRNCSNWKFKLMHISEYITLELALLLLLLPIMMALAFLRHLIEAASDD